MDKTDGENTRVWSPLYQHFCITSTGWQSRLNTKLENSKCICPICSAILLQTVWGGRVVWCRTCDREVASPTPTCDTRSWVRIPPVAAVYQRQLSVLSARGRLMSSRLVVSGLWGEGLVWLIGAVVCLSCCAAGSLVSYRGLWMAAYSATVPLAHANQLPLPWQ